VFSLPPTSNIERSFCGENLRASTTFVVKTLRSTLIQLGNLRGLWPEKPRGVLMVTNCIGYGYFNKMGIGNARLSTPATGFASVPLGNLLVGVPWLAGCRIRQGDPRGPGTSGDGQQKILHLGRKLAAHGLLLGKTEYPIQ